MSIEHAEQLKREWTDKYVIVAPEIPHLKRFQNLTGTVKTINMNCRALVEFNGPEDISWYDIDLNHLEVVDKPLEKKKAPAPAPKETKPAAKKAAAKTGGKSPLELAREQAGGAAKKPAGKKLSPIEMARQQAAAKAGGASTEAAPTGKKLSPIEMARQQDAAKKAAAQSESEDAPAESPAPSKPEPPADGGKKLSPLERARMQDKKS